MMSDKWKYTGETVCRGSFALGTACGYCRKCREQIAEHTSTKAVEHVRADCIAELEERLEKEMQDLDAADRRAKRLQARIAELEAKLAKAESIADWYDDMMNKHVTKTGNPARISDEDGVWHDGPAADMAQKILRGLQKLLAELTNPGGGGQPHTTD